MVRIIWSIPVLILLHVLLTPSVAVKLRGDTADNNAKSNDTDQYKFTKVEVK